MGFKEEWFNDDDFWKYYAPVIFDQKRWAEVPELADAITRLAGLTLYSRTSLSKSCGGPRVLDLCCGMGRITTELARRGFIATGVDLSPSLLETAREDAKYENMDIEYVQSDARSFKRPGFFDTALSLYISFGYFENPAEDLLMARNVFESLKSGGSFIIETLGKEIAARDFTPAEWFERAGCMVLTEYEAVDSWAGLKNRWILIKNDPSDYKKSGSMESGDFPERIEKTFIQRLYSASELKALLLEAGFTSVELYGGWDERSYDQNAEALIAVGRKEKSYG